MTAYTDKDITKLSPEDLKNLSPEDVGTYFDNFLEDLQKIKYYWKFVGIHEVGTEK